MAFTPASAGATGRGPAWPRGVARDHQVDTLDCGPGYDVVWLNSSESDTQVNCEVVHMVATIRTDNG